MDKIITAGYLLGAWLTFGYVNATLTAIDHLAAPFIPAMFAAGFWPVYWFFQTAAWTFG